MSNDNVTARAYRTASNEQKRQGATEEQPTSLRPAGEVVRTTLWHPASLAIPVDVTVDNLRVYFGRVKGHEGIERSELWDPRIIKGRELENSK